MKLVILAAGIGSRLKPLTRSMPKCMVKYNKKPIIDYIIDAAKSCGINSIAVVTGYKKEILENYLKNKNVLIYKNENYQISNMVSTLFCTKDFMDDDLIISYGDIIYKKHVLQKLIDTKESFSVVVDRNWKELWAQRMNNPLDDAETLKIKNGKIVELGKKALSYNEIEGQYIGLIKISKNIIKEIINIYENLNKQISYDGNSFNQMYMTSFIQIIIDKSLEVNPVFIDGGWIEIDTMQDLKINFL